MAVKLPRPRRDPTLAALLDSLTDRLAQTLPDANLREVASLLWSLAKMGRPAPGALLAQLADAAAQRRCSGPLRGAASPQAFSNILWALATWRTPGPDPLLRLLLERCGEALPAFRPQDTANTLWALAHLCGASPRRRRGGGGAAAGFRHELSLLLPGLLDAAAAQARDMTPQGLATAVWACHRLRQRHPPLLRAAADAFVVQLPAASPTDVSLLTSSLAAMRFHHPALLRAVAERCCRGGASGGDGGGAPEHAAAAAAAEASGWSAHSRQRLLWAFASLRFRHTGAVRALLLMWTPPARRDGSGNDGCGDDDDDVGADLVRDWEPGGLEEEEDRHGGGRAANARGNGDSRERGFVGSGDDSGSGGGGDGKGSTGSEVLGASSLIWCLARLGCGGRAQGPERRAALAAAARLWAARRGAGLSHAAVAAWGLERLGLRQERLLALGCERLQAALDRAAAAATAPVADASAAGAAAPRPGPDDAAARTAGSSLSGELSPGELDAAVLLLWCLTRRGPAGTAADPAAAGGAVNADADPAAAAPAAAAAAAAESRLLASFSAAAPRLLPRLSVRQLPRVCCAYVQLGRSDPGVLRTAAELLLLRTRDRGRRPAGAGSSPKGELELGHGLERAEALEATGGVDEEPGGGVYDWDDDGVREEDEAQEGEEEAGVEDYDGGWQLYAEPGLGEQEGQEEDNEAPSIAGNENGGSSTSTIITTSNSGNSGSSSSRSGSRGGGLLLWRLPRNGLAMMLWALASAGHASPQLLQRAAQRVMELFPPLPPSAAAPEPEAEAEADEPAAAAAAADADRLSGAAASRWAALILWAFAASDCYNAVLYNNLLSYVTRHGGGAGRLGAGRVAMVLWACAVAGHYRREALEELSGALRDSGMRALPPASFTQANWAIAHLSAGLCLAWRGPTSAHLASLAPSLTTHQAAVLLWALASQQLVLVRQNWREFAGEVDVLLNRLATEFGTAESAPAATEEGGQAHSPVAAAAAPANETDEDPWVGGQRLAGSGAETGADGDAAELRPAEPADAVFIGIQQVLDRVPDLDSDSGTGAAVAAPEPGSQRQPLASLEPGVALIAAEALALLLASPHAALRSRVERRLAPAPPLAAQLSAAWRRALRHRHPQQAAVAAAARQLGYSPRLLRTHAAFPLAAGCAVELPDAAPRPAVLLLAEQSDFATNVVGQPLGPLFTTVQLLRERGWLVAVVVAPQLAALRSSSRRVRLVRQLLAAAGVVTRAQ